MRNLYTLASVICIFIVKNFVSAIEKTEELDVTLTYKGDLADLQDNMVEDLKA